MQTNPILPQGELSLDCRGLQCPAPILKLADVTRQHRGRPMILGLQATDPDFLTDLEAWCRTTKSRLVESHEEGGVIFATVAIHGAVAPAAAPLAAPTFASPPVSSPTPFSSTLSSPGSSASVHSSPAPSSAGPGAGALDLRGLPVNAGMRRLAAEALQGGERRLRVLADAPEFEARLYAWATASGARLERVLTVNGQTTADLLLLADDAPPASALAPRAPQAAAPQPLAASQPLAPAPLALAAPAMPLAPAAALAPPVPAALADAAGLDSDVSVRENRATLLVLRNDLESLLSALMVANSSASQGMDVEVYFAFWGINLLRGERRRPGDEKQPGILQRMMRWMMPRGPRRQKLSKMHWGGIGKFMLELFMRQRNVLSLEQLMKEAEQQNVQLKVCSMSMGVMGIQKADLMDLPNLSFGGVTSFSESARRSSFSLVF